MDHYIKTINELIDNLPKPIFTPTIDIVCDSGGLNGGFMIGVLLYIKELEKRKYLTVNRISGASIGSYLGIFYILDKLEIPLKYINTMIEHIREKHTFSNFRDKILNKIFIDLDKESYKLLNNRMYITYSSVEELKPITKKEYENNMDVKEAIFKSCFVPFYMGEGESYDNCIDGLYPFIFKDRTVDNNKILFIKLTQYGILKKMFFSCGESNGGQRITQGILDAHSFFTTNKKTKLCSWINDWTLYDYIESKLRYLARFIIIIGIYLYQFIKKYVPEKYFKNKYANLIQYLIYEIFDDIFILSYNS